MKIGILTFHYAHNYGAVLQAYALLTKIKTIGHEAEFINYVIPRIEQVYNKRTLYQLYKFYREKQNFLKSFVKTILYYNREKLKITPKWYRFNDFIVEMLPQSRRIERIEHMLLNSYDAIVCGSDQIWSKGITQQIIPIYFCEGVGEKVRKIAYAASAGKGYIDKEDEQIFVNLCSNFNHISVREKALCEYMTKLGISNTWVSDPVFLLSKDEWCKIAVRPQITDYVLTYSFGEPVGFFETAKQIADRLNKPLVCLLLKDKKIHVKATKVLDAGPCEFIGYILNASYVVTNSFHGTAFSILLNKQFSNIPPQNGIERTKSLLTLLNLTDRIIDTKLNEYNADKVIDYNIVNKQLTEIVLTSNDFLENSLK